MAINSKVFDSGKIMLFFIFLFFLNNAIFIYIPCNNVEDIYVGPTSGGEMMTQVLVLVLAPCENELKTPGVSYRAEQLLLSLIVNSYHKIHVDVLNIIIMSLSYIVMYSSNRNDIISHC